MLPLIYTPNIRQCLRSVLRTAVSFDSMLDRPSTDRCLRSCAGYFANTDSMREVSWKANSYLTSLVHEHASSFGGRILEAVTLIFVAESDSKSMPNVDV